jgi:hypothetical protein
MPILQEELTLYFLLRIMLPPQVGDASMLMSLASLQVHQVACCCALVCCCLWSASTPLCARLLTLPAAALA